MAEVDEADSAGLALVRAIGAVRTGSSMVLRRSIIGQAILG
jgi:hypothetical protein